MSVTTYDGLGRVSQTESKSDPDGADYTTTTYTGTGQIASVSNPHRTQSDSTYGTIQYSYDALNRMTSQTNQDGSTKQWNYSANIVYYYDELQNEWKRAYDAFGDLTQVLEPNASKTPSYETDYYYDAVGNLTSVSQGGPSGTSGARVRSFA